MCSFDPYVLKVFRCAGQPLLIGLTPGGKTHVGSVGINGLSDHFRSFFLSQFIYYGLIEKVIDQRGPAQHEIDLL